MSELITMYFSQFLHYQFIFVVALNLKEIPYEIKPVSLIKSGGEQHSNEYRDINPMEQVPALQIDGHTLIESVNIHAEPIFEIDKMILNLLNLTLFLFQLNIIYYLEETRPQRPLMPQDIYKRAKVIL